MSVFTHFLTHTHFQSVRKTIGQKCKNVTINFPSESCFPYSSLNGGSLGVTILIKLLALTSNKFYVPHKTCELTLGWRSQMFIVVGSEHPLSDQSPAQLVRRGLLVIFSSSQNPWNTQKFCPRSRRYLSLLWYASVHHCYWVLLFIRAIIWVKLIFHVQFENLNCFCNLTYHLPFGRTISHLRNIINISCQ